jgi:hypothetical protein
MSNVCHLPTVLVAGPLKVRDPLVEDLQHEGYLVLESKDGAEASEIVRVHSRPIQVMLIDESAYGRTLGAKLAQYRPNMRVLYINWHAQEGDRDSLAPHKILGKIREVLKAPEQTSGGNVERIVKRASA